MTTPTEARQIIANDDADMIRRHITEYAPLAVTVSIYTPTQRTCVVVLHADGTYVIKAESR